MRKLYLFIIISFLSIAVNAQKSDCYTRETSDYAAVVCIVEDSLQAAVELQGFPWTLPLAGTSYDAVTYRNLDIDKRPICAIFFRKFLTLEAMTHEAFHCANVTGEEERSASIAGKLNTDLTELFIVIKQEVYTKLIVEGDTLFFNIFVY